MSAPLCEKYAGFVLCLTVLLLLLAPACRFDPAPATDTPEPVPSPSPASTPVGPPATAGPTVELSGELTPLPTLTSDKTAATPTPVSTPPLFPSPTTAPRPVSPPPLRATAVPAEASSTLPPTAEPAPTRAPSVPSALTRETSPVVSGQDLAALAKGNTSFALALYRQLASGGDGNLFYSPYSISQALAMTYAGARGETEEQMAGTMVLGLSQERLHPAFNSLDLSLAPQSREGEEVAFQLSIANSVWGQEGHGFLPDFLDTLALNYGGQVRDVDFRASPEDARLRINDWVARETENRVQDLIPRDAIDRFTRLVLANAVYFKAGWQSPFDERATSTAPFHALDGSEGRVSMMRQTAYFGYSRGDGYQAVDLPYQGGAVSMTILLPDDGQFAGFESSFDPEGLSEILLGLESTRLRLSLPRFELEASLDLANTLGDMGMPSAFDGRRAEFQGMDGLSCLAGDDECLLISDVVHKAFVSVDEAGTEAAAATAVIIGITRAEPGEPLDVTIDRPFIYLVRHHETGTILFLGRVLKL